MILNNRFLSGWQEKSYLYLHYCDKLISWVDRDLHNLLSGGSLFLFIYILKFYLFYFLLCWVFVAACGPSLVAASRGYSSLSCACTGFSLWWLLLLQSTGYRRAGFSSCGSQALELRLNSCGTRA